MCIETYLEDLSMFKPLTHNTFLDNVYPLFWLLLIGKAINYFINW